jgi:hypothetical protein
MNYSNQSLSKNLMSNKLSLKHASRQTNSTLGAALGGKKYENMNSFFNSNYDKNASTTIDGTQVSIQNYDISMRTDVDPVEQAHNSMNLSLGKPTQTHQQQFSKAKKQSLVQVYGGRDYKDKVHARN